MKKVLTYITVFLYIYLFYVIFTGGIAEFSLVLGLIGSVILTTFLTSFIIQREIVFGDLKRFFYLVFYYFRYMIIDEVKAHAMVIKIVLSPKIDIRPAIVKVPFNVKTYYGITLVAGSITNTPGTCVVDVDEEKKTFYVHWIYATTTEPEKAREEISKVFEEYAMKIFG